MDFSPNLVGALIMWRSGLGLLKGNFRQFSTELSVHHTFIFSFPDKNVSKTQWIFTKLGVRIDDVEVWFGIANGQKSSLSESSACHTSVFSFPDGNLCKYQCSFTKLGMYIDIVECGLEWEIELP